MEPRRKGERPRQSARVVEVRERRMTGVEDVVRLLGDELEERACDEPDDLQEDQHLHPSRDADHRDSWVRFHSAARTRNGCSERCRLRSEHCAGARLTTLWLSRPKSGRNHQEARPVPAPGGDHSSGLVRVHFFLGDIVKPVIAALAFLGAIACATSGSGVDPRLEYTYNSSVTGVIVVPEATAGSDVCNNLAVVASVGDTAGRPLGHPPEQGPLLVPDRQPALRQGSDGQGAARLRPQVPGWLADGLRRR